MQTEEILIVINIFDVHKNQQPPHRHLEFLPESKFRIHFLFIFRNVNKFTCSFVLFNLFCMIVCTGKLYTEILSWDLRIYLNLVILAGIVEPRCESRSRPRGRRLTQSAGGSVGESRSFLQSGGQSSFCTFLEGTEDKSGLFFKSFKFLHSKHM